MPFKPCVVHKHVTIFKANRYDPVIKIIVAAGIVTISLAWLISDVESLFESQKMWISSNISRQTKFRSFDSCAYVFHLIEYSFDS